LCQSVLVGVADHLRDAGKGSDLMGSALGIAARDQDLAIRVAAQDAANRSTGVLFRGSSYCAGIKDYVISSGGSRGALQPTISELLLDGSPIGLGGAATEIFYVKAGHAPILAYIQLSLRETPGHGARVVLRFA
jgi:hypothetical protein